MFVEKLLKKLNYFYEFFFFVIIRIIIKIKGYYEFLIY